jgi:phospholipid/cholesterol/gamma-HCH transport system permease protein
MCNLCFRIFSNHIILNSMKLESPKTEHYHVSIIHEGELLVRFGKHVDVSTADLLFNSLLSDISKIKPQKLTLDLVATRHLDDYGIIVIMEMQEMIVSQNGHFELVNAPPEILKRLDHANNELIGQCAIQSKPIGPNIFIRFGDAAIREAYHVRFMISFLGSVVMSFFHVIRHPGALRVEETISHMEKTGVDAVPIVGMISFLLGLIMAFMSSIQLSQFGANIYVASLVALAMVSELGPIMTAIIVAGRTGSLFAAEIGTMQISEEVDALFVMGINPTLFLAIPRVMACIIVVPLLTLFSDFFAITGGMVVGVSLLNLTPGSYLAQTWETITLFEVLWGMLKSVIFAILISWAGCLRGFQVRGGADAVGQATTSAVVSSIFLIILVDSIFAVIRSYF